MDAIETFKHLGYEIEIHRDVDASDPREDDNIGTMVCWHSRYDLGDKHEFANPSEFETWAKENHALVLPLFLYDHSGITMRTSEFGDPWDSGQVGYIYALPEKIKEEYGDAPDAEEKTRKYLVGEVETYDTFLRGEVYGFMMTDPDGEDGDSCWGFFGLDYCRQEAKDSAAYSAKHRNIERQKKLKAQIKNRVPLARRGA